MQDNEKKPALRFKGFTDPWEQRKLGELGTLKNGMNFSKAAMGIGYPFVNLQNIFGKNVVDISALGKAMASLGQLKDYSLLKGDVLFVRSSVKLEGVGEAALVPESLDKTTYSGFIIRFRDEEGIDNNYKRFVFATEQVRNQIISQATDSANKNISQSVLADLDVPLPELEEQSKIGQYFSDLDTLITLHQRKYERLVNIKKSMLDKMFPKNGASMPEIRFKSFTDLWEQRKLGDITVELSEYATQELGLPLLTSSRSGLMYQDEYRDSRTTKSTETLFSVVPVGTCTYRHMSDDDVFHMNINTLEKGLVSREYPVFEASKGNNLEFLVQHINSSEEFKAFCAEQKKGGTRTRLYYNTLCQFTVRVPALKEQAQISQCLKKLDTLITLHQREHIKPILEVKRVKRNE